MLQAIRNNAQGIFVWIVVGLIVISFALFGLGSYLSGASKVVAASVNGVEISSTRLTRAYQDYQERLRQMFGEQYRPDMFPAATIKRQVLQQLITEEVLNQHLAEQGYHASAQQILAQLKQYKAFQDGGEFSAARYKQVLAIQGMNGEAFEAGLAQDIATQQMQSGISNSNFLTATEQQYLRQLQNQHREVGYFEISLRPYRQSVSVTDNEITEFYKKNQQRFMSEEKVQLEYVELDLAALAQKQTISDAMILQHYESAPDNYMQVDEAAAKKKLAAIRQQIVNGADFAEMAKKYSQDKSSAANGGELGYVTRGNGEAFDNAVFALKKGEVSDVVKSEQGFQIMQVDDIRDTDPEERLVRLILIKPEKKMKPLNMVKDEIRKELQYQQASKIFYDDSDEMNNLGYENPESLEPVADALGLPVKVTGFFTRRGGEGIAADPKVLAAAFSNEVLNEGRNSELIELSDSHVLVLRVKKHLPAKVKPLEQIKSQIKAALLDEKAAAKADAVASEMLAKLKSGAAITTIQRDYKHARWHAKQWIGRRPDPASAVSPLLRQQIFAMAKPQNNTPVWEKFALSQGKEVVAGVFAIKVDEKAGFDANQYAAMMGTTDFSAYIEFLRSRADISVNESVFETDNTLN